MSGRVVHFEIPFDDGDRARSFYGEAFGWSLMHLPEMSYTMVSTGPTSDQGPPTEPGYINGGMVDRGAPVGTPTVVVDVEDIEAALEKIEKLGGTTLTPKQAVAQMGFSAYFKDPEGNVLGLWQSA